MAKQKRLVSFNEPHYKMLTHMMEEDGNDSVSYFLGTLISREYKERLADKAKRPQGRPKKGQASDEEVNEELDDYSDDLPKSIAYYGTMIGPREYADKLALQEQFKSKG